MLWYIPAQSARIIVVIDALIVWFLTFIDRVKSYNLRHFGNFP